MRIAIACVLTTLAAPPLAGATAHHHRAYKYGKRVLRPGDRGKDVKALQYYLSKVSLPASIDGFYGPGTRHSVKAWEITNRARNDGVVQRGQAKRIRAAAKAKKVAGGPFVFPVAGAHSFGTATNGFGAPRKGHTHQGQDILAACGLPLRAAQGGHIRTNAYQASGAGFYVVIRGEVTGEDYVYDHLAERSLLPAGAPVTAGQVIGSVGATGDAQGCHLHFEMWTLPGWYLGGHPYDPLPSLLAWDAYS